MGVQNDETTRKVAEDTAADGNVGSPVTATDPAPNSDALDYTLEGAEADSFIIDCRGSDQSGRGDEAGLRNEDHLHGHGQGRGLL